MTNKMISEITSLVENAKTVFVSSVDENGYPNTKAMLSLQRDGLGVHYFSTNLSSKRVSQFKQNPKACIYYCDESAFQGLMLTGKIEVCTDSYHKELLWREGFEIYYPNGVTDDDYCVYKFIAEKARYYPGSRETFDINELIKAELMMIIEKFAESGWDLISIPSKAWLDNRKNTAELITAIEQADKECGSCGCEFDNLYKKALIYLKSNIEIFCK